MHSLFEMRRQARTWAGGARSLRTATALQVWLWLLIFLFQNEFRISRSIQPGYLDFDNLPDTNFTCTGKVIGGYYADLETSCQMFHVCTVGQQDEPMDIKFLCLNGTVFDQETRVCERVDEVDCTKSEAFYSLNLELYGSTVPPIVQPDQNKPQDKPTEQYHHDSESEIESDPSVHDANRHDNDREHSTEIQDSTEDPPHDGPSDQNRNHQSSSTHASHPATEQLSQHVEPIEENQEEDEEDNENIDYEEDYTIVPPTTTTAATTTSIKSPSSTVARVTGPSQAPSSFSYASPASTVHASVPSPSIVLSAPSSHQPPTSVSIAPSTNNSPSSVPTPSSSPLDPALLSPQEFIYRHRGPGSEAISFQRQSFRPADGVYITHAPPQQFDHFQYESSRTAPRSPSLRPVPFAQRPSPFRTTTLDPRDQLLRPGPASQPSERHETTVKHRYQSYTSAASLPALRPLPIEPFHFEHNRNQGSENQAFLSARSAAPPTHTGRYPSKPKSPPRVIVTASASVSDSNGKRLNYTVGNVVSAVKPIVPINYDDYKESDLIFDPFFLDVPKLKKYRKGRSNVKTIIAVRATTIASKTTVRPTTTRFAATATTAASVTAATDKTTTTTTAAWNPDDYVDDNYEPQAYLPAAPPLAALLSFEGNKYSEKLRNKHKIKDDHNYKPKTQKIEESRPTLSIARTQIPSSQREAPWPLRSAAPRTDASTAQLMSS